MTRPLAITLAIASAILALAGVLALESTAQESGPVPPTLGCAELEGMERRACEDSDDSTAVVSATLSPRAPQLDPGVGYRPEQGATSCIQFGAQGRRTYPMDLSADPWPGGRYDHQAFRARYCGGEECGGSSPCGRAGEEHDVANDTALINTYIGLCDAIPIDRGEEGYTGIPTLRERWDLSVTEDRCSEAYRECWWELKEGGSPSRAIEATPRQLEWLGACEPGLVYTSSGTCTGHPGWGSWYEITQEALDQVPGRPWCDESGDGNGGEDEGEEDGCPEGCVTECPDCPDPVPECSTACLDLADEVEELDGLLAMHRDLAPTYARIPGEDSVCVESPEGRFRRDVEWVQRVIQNQRALVRLLASECRGQRQCIVPGVVSTGRVEMELLPGGPR